MIGERERAEDDIPSCSSMAFNLLPLVVLLADTAYVRVFISDVNDNKPVFAQRLYEVGIDEDADVGLAVVTVGANDEDEGMGRKDEMTGEERERIKPGMTHWQSWQCYTLITFIFPRECRLWHWGSEEGNLAQV